MVGIGAHGSYHFLEVQKGHQAMGSFGLEALIKTIKDLQIIVDYFDSIYILFLLHIVNILLNIIIIIQ